MGRLKQVQVCNGVLVRLHHPDVGQCVLIDYKGRRDPLVPVEYEGYTLYRVALAV